MGTITAVVMFCLFAAGAYFIFFDKKERAFIGYGFAFVAVAIGVLFKVLGN